MKDSVGDPQFPIWLVSDAPPENWDDKLKTPLDARHPARHNIWTSVADYMQEMLYREKRLRLDTGKLYIRNAVNKALLKPDGQELNWTKLQEEIESWSDRLQKHKPQVVLLLVRLPLKCCEGLKRKNPGTHLGTGEHKN